MRMFNNFHHYVLQEILEIFTTRNLKFKKIKKKSLLNYTNVQANLDQMQTKFLQFSKKAYMMKLFLK